jgi:peroxiredoxin
MERLHRAFAGSDFRVVAVSVDQEPSAVVRQFATELGLTFDILHDPTGKIQRIYRTTGVPESWIIDRSGTIVKKVVGATEWDSPTNTALVQALLDAR